MVSSVIKKRSHWFNPVQIVLCMWAMTFGYLIWEDNYTLFLKPDFSFLVYAGLVICLLFFVSGFFKKGLVFSRQSIINGTIIILPVIYILLAGDSTLGTHALSKRTLIMPKLGEISKQTIAKSDNKEIVDGDVLSVSLSDIITKWNLYDGKTVSVEGLFSKTVQEDETLSLVFKYLISCCAADAQPLGIFVEKEKTEGISDNDWVKVTGVVNWQEKEGSAKIVMTLKHIEKLEKPDKISAYLFY